MQLRDALSRGHLVLLEAVPVYVAKVTPKRVTLYLPDKADPSKVKKVAVAHKSVAKYASKVVDPPPEEQPFGVIEDPANYTDPSMIKPLGKVTKAPSTPVATKKAKFVPVYDWDGKSIWVWLKASGGKPILTEIPHKKVQSYAHRLGWSDLKINLTGKIDPYTYTGPEDVLPLDWEPGDGVPDFVPTISHAVSTKFEPEFDAESEKLPPIDPNAASGVGTLNVSAEFAPTGTKDPQGLVQIKHKGSGLIYSVLPDSSLAVWDPDIEKYFPIKKGDDGWDFDHDKALVAPEALGSEGLVPPEGFTFPPGKGYKIQTVAKGYVVATTADGTPIKWMEATNTWVHMDEPWKAWEPESAASFSLSTSDPQPEGAPKAPPGFKVAPAPNKDGAWPLLTQGGEFGWFILPNQKLAKYDEYQGAYQLFTYGSKGIVPNPGPPMPAVAVKVLKYYGDPLPVPSGYQLVGYDFNGLPMVKYGIGVSHTLLPNGKLVSWSFSQEAYKTFEGKHLTIGEALSGASEEALVPKISDTPEDLPHAVKALDKLDPNGFPMVDEVDPDDPDSSLVAKGLTLLPDERLALLTKLGNYTLYKWDTDEGYVKTYETISVKDVERLMQALKLTVKGFRYHRIEATGSDSELVGGAPGFGLLKPTPEEQGLVPAKHNATGKWPFYLLPGNRVAGPGPGDLWELFSVGADGGLTALNKQVTLTAVHALTQGYDPDPPDHTKFVVGKKAFDKNGYPRVVDVDGEKLTLLPNGEVAKWDKKAKSYEVWAYDHGFKGYYPKHPEKLYTLKQVQKLKLKKLKTYKSITHTKVPEPKVTPPKVAAPAVEEPPKGTPVPTGKKDPNGYDLYKFGDLTLSKIPIDTGWGSWSPAVKAYAIRVYDPSSGFYTYKRVTGTDGKHKRVRWYPGDPDVSIGLKPSKPPPEPSEPVTSGWAFVPAETKGDQFGYPQVKVLKNGKYRATFTKLPSGDLGSWSDANAAYLVFKIDPDAPPGGIPYYNTGKLFQPGSVIKGYKYPFSVNWKLPHEWEPDENLEQRVLGMWYAHGNKYDAKLRPTGVIEVLIMDPKLKWVEVWNPTDGYLDTPFAPKKPVGSAEASPEVDPEQAAKDVSAASKPSDKSASQLIADLDGKLPDIKTLTFKGSGNHLGGAGDKSIFEDPTTGLRFIFKPAIPKSGSGVEPVRAHAQEAFSALALRVRPEHVPVRAVMYKGKLGTLQPLLDLDPKHPSLKGSGGLNPEELTAQQQADVATEHLLSWLTSQHDDHRGNLIKTKDGRILSIDKEQGWKYFDIDKLDIHFHPNSKYGEEEPFYNKFWKAFAAGSIDFDPMQMKPALEKLEAFESKDFVAVIQKYAQAAFPGDVVKRDRFLSKALKRKLHLRKDFEDFLTDLYRKQTGKTGAFTFDEGWVARDEAKQKKFKKIKVAAPQLAAEHGLAIKPFKFVGPGGVTESEEKITLKVPKSYPESKLFDFLGELGLEPLLFPNGEKYIEGNAYKMVSVDKKKFDQVHLEKEVPITEAFIATPAKPKYWPELPEARKMEPSLKKDLASVDKLKMGREGHAMLSDGTKVEGQAIKAKRFKDPKGGYLLLTFKLRPKYWQQIKNSNVTKPGEHTWYVSDYDPKTDTYVENRNFPTYTTTQGEKMTGGKIYTASGVKWGLSKTECFLVTSKSEYCFMGQIYMKIRGSSGDVNAIAKAALNKAVPGLGDEIFSSPSPEDLLVMKMMRLLWALHPKTADALPESDRTVSKLTQILKSKKISMKTLGQIEEQEVVKGYHSHVLPGRWKTMPEVAYLFNGIRDLPAAASVCRTGLMGIHERNLSGIQQFGGSYGADVKSGSGDGVLCRVVTKAAFGSKLSASPFSGQYQAIVHPEALDRLDAYMYRHDTYGRCRDDYSGWTNRSSVESQIEGQAKSWTTDNEISFRKGLHLRQILRICTSAEPLRKGLINAARAEGIESVNGVPIEDFVVVAQSHSDVYNRYVKPLLPTPSV